MLQATRHHRAWQVWTAQASLDMGHPSGAWQQPLGCHTDGEAWQHPEVWYHPEAWQYPVECSMEAALCNQAWVARERPPIGIHFGTRSIATSQRSIGGCGVILMKNGRAGTS